MDKETYYLGTANGPVSETPMVGPQVQVPHMAAKKIRDIATDTGTYGVVQDAGASSPVRRNTVTPCAGRDGKHTW